MWDTASRSFELLRRLQSREHRTAEFLAGDLGVTARTVRRDIARLRDLGYPIDTVRGPDGGYSLEPGAVLPPIFFSFDEAIMCSLALRKWEDSADQASISTTLDKIRMALPRRVRWVADAVVESTHTVAIDRVHQIASYPVDPARLGELATACKLNRRIEFTHVRRDGQARRRTVDPHVLVNASRRWYLVAFDVDAADWRTYRIDRITDIAATEFPAGRRSLPGGDLDAWIIAQLGAGWRQVEAVVRVHASLVEVQPWIAPAWGEVEFETENTCILKVGADTYGAIARWLLLIQADVTVIRPVELSQAFGVVAGQAKRAAES